MRKTVLLTILLSVCMLNLPADSRDKVLAEVDQLIANRQLSEAMSSLSRAIRDHAADPVHQALYIKALGDFHRDICGDMRRAAMNYRRIINSGIPENHELKQSAQREIARIKEIETKQRDINTRLKRLSARANRKREPAAVEQDISQLNELIDNNPGYYLLHEAYYALGMNYQYLKKPGKAYPLLEKAIEIKPGIVFYLPAKAQAEKARAAHIRNNINNVTLVFLYLLLLAIMILFYKSRPYRWFRLKHITPLIILILCWWLVFTISHGLLGHIFSGGKGRVVVVEEGRDTEYFSASPGSPGSEKAKPLFQLGLIGVCALFLFSLSMRQFKGKKLVVISTIIYGFLVFATLSTLYYMKYCDQKGVFMSEGKGISYYIGGRMLFYPEDPEPNVLTNPLAYPGIEVSKVEDPYLREWIRKNCPEVIE